MKSSRTDAVLSHEQTTRKEEEKKNRNRQWVGGKMKILPRHRVLTHTERRDHHGPTGHHAQAFALTSLLTTMLRSEDRPRQQKQLRTKIDIPKPPTRTTILFPKRVRYSDARTSFPSNKNQRSGYLPQKTVYALKIPPDARAAS